jgi:hypothetical protein
MLPIKRFTEAIDALIVLTKGLMIASDGLSILIKGLTIAIKGLSLAIDGLTVVIKGLSSPGDGLTYVFCFVAVFEGAFAYTKSSREDWPFWRRKYFSTKAAGIFVA